MELCFLVSGDPILAAFSSGYTSIFSFFGRMIFFIQKMLQSP